MPVLACSIDHGSGYLAVKGDKGRAVEGVEAQHELLVLTSTM